ncbi:hypothetical protein D6T64_17420 [Cryobacterium melibiosiphilum]|uniref:DUF4287 domain-containing protein n=1 Tax=Cryobacterium melibiosiphilum TaxID=995039 RepID=A0A3A5MG10_9MICO|nr:hypothetical protein [Cryobacterium melibiosiphilum]RJT86909.1 hypothetical protein D6T64_17420 [Cryobacterium melibiosiphilum]
MTPINSSSEGISDEALIAATGRSRDDWFALLDEQGMAGAPAHGRWPSKPAWPHPQIARWLHDEHGVDAWWCQGITVGYEQARGLRRPGQRADGTFEVSASKTFALEQTQALDVVVAVLTASLGAPSSRSSTAAYATARWPLPGQIGATESGGSLLATANPTKNGRTSVTLTNQRLADPGALAPVKIALTAWLAAAGFEATRALG